MAGRAGLQPRSPYPSRAMNVDPAGARGKRLRLPREICARAPSRAGMDREVRRTGAELGVAFDGDGDRIGAVDEDGTILFGDQLLVVLGRDAVRRFGPGISVIFDVKCSEVLPKALAAAGAKPEMWKTGHSLIKARMKELKAPLAGEMSGHIFFGGDYFGWQFQAILITQAATAVWRN